MRVSDPFPSWKKGLDSLLQVIRGIIRNLRLWVQICYYLFLSICSFLSRSLLILRMHSLPQHDTPDRGVVRNWRVWVQILIYFLNIHSILEVLVQILQINVRFPKTVGAIAPTVPTLTMTLPESSENYVTIALSATSNHSLRDFMYYQMLKIIAI